MGAGLPLAADPPTAALAIFAARSRALLFVRGAMVGADKLLGRGAGRLAGAGVGGAPLDAAVEVDAAEDVAPFAFPFAFRTAPAEREAGAVEGRGAGRAAGVLVVRASVVRAGAAGCTDAAEGGRAKLGREVGVPLKDCREDERDGTVGCDGPRTGGRSASEKRSRNSKQTYT